MLKQIHWRVAGGVALAVCAAMAWWGTKWDALRESPALFLFYWAVFFAAFAVVLYCVVLDLRYIRLEYVVENRDIFKETLGDEEFRRALREAQLKKAQEQQQANDSNRDDAPT